MMKVLQPNLAATVFTNLAAMDVVIDVAAAGLLANVCA
jgi:hypothetical protein